MEDASKADLVEDKLDEAEAMVSDNAEEGQAERGRSPEGSLELKEGEIPPTDAVLATVPVSEGQFVEEEEATMQEDKPQAPSEEQ